MSKKWVSLADLQRQKGIDNTPTTSQGSVYSTDKGRLCPNCGESRDACQCQAKAREAIPDASAKVQIRLEKKGRKGKGVTVIEGLPLALRELEALAKSLRQHCGVGGTSRPGLIELQGDQREKVSALLREQKLL